MKLTKKKVGLLLLAIGIAAICFAAFLWMKQKPADDFWGQLGITRKQVEEVRLVYEGQEVRMEDQMLADFLDTLSTMKKTEVSDTHEFCPSDVGVIFVAAGKQHPVTFYWFPYIVLIDAMGSGSYGAPPPVRLTKPLDDRVDVKLGDTLYHFRLTTERKWTEDMMLQAYDTFAEKQGAKERYALLGATELKPQWSGNINGVYTLDEMMEESDLIFLGTYAGCYAPYYSPIGDCQDHNQYIEEFRVDEVLKGKADERYYRMYRGNRLNRIIQATDQYLIPDFSNQNPDYKQGEQYLICIRQEEPGISGENDFYFGQYGSAVVDGDTLFPRFNTEDHPFYNVKIQTLRDLLAE